MTTIRRPQRGGSDMVSRILDVAERLLQQRGFNGFSYADIAAELHVTKAALHYHFAGKGELGEALIARYAAHFLAALEALDTADVAAPTKLEGYARLYLEVLRNERMCLCGMLAAEYQTLPELMKLAVISFFDANQRWLERVVDQGQREGTLRTDQVASDIAQTIVGSFEGAMLVARPYGDSTRFEAAVRPLLASLVTGPTSVHASAKARPSSSRTRAARR
jgi:TetR/AcrR family transcriptional repressor of nem operon